MEMDWDEIEWHRNYVAELRQAESDAIRKASKGTK